MPPTIRVSSTRVPLRAWCLVLLLCASATLFAFPSTTEAAAALNFLQFTGDGTNATTHTFTSQNLGAPTGDRIIVVLVSVEDKSAGGLSESGFTVTVAGVAATKDVSAVDTGNGDLSGIFRARVPSGTSGSIVVTTDVNTNVGIGVYRVTGISINPVPLHTASDLEDNLTMSLNIPKNGIAFAVGSFESNFDDVTTTGVTEDFEQEYQAGTDRAVGGSVGPLPAETGRSIIFDSTASAGTNATGVSVSYAPGFTAISKPPNNLGLVGYWSFNEGTSTVATDFSGNGNTGTLTSMANPPTAVSGWATGKRGKALNFDGSNDYVDISPSASLNNLGPLTVSAWIKLDTLPGVGGCVATKSNTGTGWDFVIDDTAGVKLEVHYDGASNVEKITLDPLITVGRWHHVAATWSGTAAAASVRLYQNGVEPANDGGTAGVGSHNPDTSDNLALGSDDGVGCQIDGLIDEVRVYNRALGATEVLALSKVGAVKFTTSSVNLQQGSTLANGLVGHWTFDGPDITTTVTDRSGQNNHGYFNGGATSSAKVIGKLGQALQFDGVNDKFPAAATSISTSSTPMVVPSVLILLKRWNSLTTVLSTPSARLSLPVRGIISFLWATVPQ